MHSIDLNADLGEHPDTDLDELMMPFISSCNIACGGHVGSIDSVRKTVKLAKEFDVAVGAHPSYPDKENFGRKVIKISMNTLSQSITEQIRLIKQVCEEEKVSLHHVKPHGALYNEAAKNPAVAQVILEALKSTSQDLPWMGLAGSVSERIATTNRHPFIAEGFADRKYENDGSLRSRAKNGAVLRKQEVLDQVQELVINQRVKADNWIRLNIQSICLHGDTKGAVTLAKEIKKYLEGQGIQIASV